MPISVFFHKNLFIMVWETENKLSKSVSGYFMYQKNPTAIKPENNIFLCGFPKSVSA